MEMVAGHSELVESLSPAPLCEMRPGFAHGGCSTHFVGNDRQAGRRYMKFVAAIGVFSQVQPRYPAARVVPNEQIAVITMVGMGYSSSISSYRCYHPPSFACLPLGIIAMLLITVRDRGSNSSPAQLSGWGVAAPWPARV